MEDDQLAEVSAVEEALEESTLVAPVAEEEPAMVTEEAPVVEAAAPAHWEESTWKGLPQLRCNYCGYTTLHSQSDMEQHVLRHLTPPPRAASPLVGPHGEAL